MNHFFIKARSLENQIDGKLVELSRLGTTLKSPDFGSDRTPLLSDEGSVDLHYANNAPHITPD